MQKELNATSGSQFAIGQGSCLICARRYPSVNAKSRENNMRIEKIITRGCFDLFSNSLHLFLKYGNQSGEFVSEHWGLKCRIKRPSREKILFDCVSVFLHLPFNACH